MKTVLYHVPGYPPREHACEPGEEKGLLNLLDQSGAVIVRGVPVYEDPAAVDGKPAGYCSPVKVKSEKPEPAPKPATKKAPREYTLKDDTNTASEGILAGD